MDEMDELEKRHLAQIVRVISDITAAQTQVLQRVERGLVDQGKAFKELTNLINLLDKKLSGGFTVLENNRLASMDKNVSESLRNLDYTYLKKLKNDLDTLHHRLQQQVNAQLLQLLIKKSKQVAIPPRVAAKRVSEAPPFRRRTPAPIHAIATAIPSAPAASAQAESEAEVIEGDWEDIELEGGRIFDTIITGWKRRDWEKEPKGTKAMFMRAWMKLSSKEKQEVKMGAWSKVIIKKMKLKLRDS
ncbi:MAG: hypothetical protein HWN65_06860 [Candidatus Helarchaeota archaeon]|nr:hypothetical protein [Candidatus Helarchaeota archaeon]